MFFIGRLAAALAVAAGLAGAQSSLFNDQFLQWIAADTPFVAIDVRGDATPDSIVYPCFYAPRALPVTNGFSCHPRLVIYCHAGYFAAAQASLVVAGGYPADSVFHSGFDTLTGVRYPATDTLPLGMLEPDAVLPQDLSALELMAALPGKKEFRLIDIRTAAELAGGMIPGACHYTWTEPFMTGVVQFDKSVDIVLNCASGNRARSARTHLIDSGFDSTGVINFGGFSKWTDAGGIPVYAATAGCRTECGGSGIIHKLPALDGRLTVSPNPFSGTLYLTGMAPGSSVMVFSADGAPVRRLAGPAWDGTDMNGNTVEPGIYLLRITDGSRVVAAQVVKGR